MVVLNTLLALSVASLPLAQACAGKNYRPAGNVMRRQDIASSAAPAAGTTPTATVPSVAGVVGATSPPSSVPLESIYASMATVSVPLPAVPTAGQQPSITNAAPLPACASQRPRLHGVHARRPGLAILDLSHPALTHPSCLCVAPRDLHARRVP